MGSSCLGLSVLPVTEYLFPSSVSRSFSHNFIKYIFNSFLFVFFSWRRGDVNVGMLDVVPEAH